MQCEIDRDARKLIQRTITVEYSTKSLSKDQEARAKRVRKAFKAVNTPCLQDFKSLASLNLIKDRKVITEGINLTEKAHSPDIRSLKEKSAQLRN